MMNRRMQPSWRQARSVKALSGHPILANSRTYHGFRVNFQVALDSTTKTGHRERTQPIQNIQRIPLFLGVSTSTAFICIVPFGEYMRKLLGMGGLEFCARDDRCGETVI